MSAAEMTHPCAGMIWRGIEACAANKGCGHECYLENKVRNFCADGMNGCAEIYKKSLRVQKSAKKPTFAQKKFDTKFFWKKRKFSLHLSLECVNIFKALQESTKEYPGVAKFGIALEWGSRGRWFESSHSDQEKPCGSMNCKAFCFTLKWKNV